MMMLLITNVLQNQRRDGVKLYGKQILWNHLYLVSRGATTKHIEGTKEGYLENVILQWGKKN